MKKLMIKNDGLWNEKKSLDKLKCLDYLLIRIIITKKLKLSECKRDHKRKKNLSSMI